MKVKKIAALAAIAMLTLASCKKDWVCECDITADGMNMPSTELQIQDAKKSDAEDLCDTFQTTSSAAGATASCDLKEK